MCPAAILVVDHGWVLGPGYVATEHASLVPGRHWVPSVPWVREMGGSLGRRRLEPFFEIAESDFEFEFEFEFEVSAFELAVARAVGVRFRTRNGLAVSMP